MKPYGALQDVWDPKYLHREELYLILSRFLQNVYLKYLMVPSKDYRVVVVEPLLCPSHFRNTLARALFNHFSVPHVAFMPSPLLSTFSLGRQTALVVDIGWLETTVIPLYEGVPIMSAWQSTSCAAKTVHNTVLECLIETGVVTDTHTQEQNPAGTLGLKELIQGSLEDVIVSTCAVRSMDCDMTPPEVSFPLSQQHTLCLPGPARDSCAEGLFEEGEGDLSLPAAVLESLLKCPCDCRRDMSENILVLGGIASLPGLNYRLKQELERLASDKNERFSAKLGALQFKFHQPPAHPSTAAWLGGSIFGTSEVAVLERAVSKEKFREMNQRLPDWTSCDPEQHERLRPVPTRKLLPAAPSSLYKSTTKTQSAH
jgi:actin-related protein 10